MTNSEIICAFPRYEGPGQSGFVTDFVGSKTRTSYVNGLTASGTVEDYPVVANFHATATEWAGALRAVLEAEPRHTLTVAELGAGWGPWLVSMTLAAASRGVHTVQLIGVEGAAEHVAFMHTHFADNGLDPRQHRLMHGVVGTKDGTVEFPVLPDPASVYGATPVPPTARTLTFRSIARPVYRRVRTLLGRAPYPATTVRVKQFSLLTIFRDYPRIDLVHIDIQGDEYKVVASARTMLRQKVRRLVIGTHGRDIEEQLRQELSANGWTLEADEQCIFLDEETQQALYRDGCQVWSNPSLA